MRMGWIAVAGWALCAAAASAQAPLAIYGNKQTIEIAPVLLAAEQSGAVVRMGGIPNLVGEPGAPGLSEPGEADLATNAETQLLRQSVKHSELRIILGVSEGLYRIVARRSAGIATVADLKGKRVATIEATSAGYFLAEMLRGARLSLADITVKSYAPLSGMSEALARREVDAVVIWEPEALHAEQVLGPDAIDLRAPGSYRELFNLNTTAAKLADPAMRARIVAFVRTVMAASGEIGRDPSRAQAAVAAAGGFKRAEVVQSWQHHRFTPGFPDDLLAVMTREEAWLAARDGRPARTRDQLAMLIDRSVYDEAMDVERAR